MTPRFDPTVNLGHLISVTGVIIFVAGSFYLTDYRLSTLEKNVEKLSTVIVESARVDERIKDYGRRIELLERR